MLKHFIVGPLRSTEASGAAPTSGQQDTSGGDGKNSADPTGQTPAAAQAGTDKTFTQADLDRIVQERLKDDRQRRAREDADKRAKEQGEWQKVAEQHEARVKELEPLQERVTALETMITNQLKDREQRLPKELRDLLPDGDVLIRMTALEKFEQAAAKLSTAATPGTPAGPNGSGASVQVGGDLVEANKKQLDQSGKYSRY